jgi:hypothetical protein
MKKGHNRKLQTLVDWFYGLGFKELLYWQLVKRVIATITIDP